jgi:hypothetical protein
MQHAKVIVREKHHHHTEVIHGIVVSTLEEANGELHLNVKNMETGHIRQFPAISSRFHSVEVIA